MATISDFGPLWWDRDVDDQGIPIRADVRQAAHGLWPEAVRRVRRTVCDPAEAAELIETSVVHISRHLDRTDVPAFAANIPSLLSLHFSQELRRLAKRLGRIMLMGDSSAIETMAVTGDWADQVDRQLDFEKVIACLNPLSRTLLVMRLEQHSWQLIGAKLGRPAATLRKSFWKDLHGVLSRMANGNGSGEKGSEK